MQAKLLFTSFTCLALCHGKPITNSDSTNNNNNAPYIYAAADEALNSAETQLAELTVQSQAADNSKTEFKLSLLPAPEKTAESVKLEQEAIPSKILSKYDYTQQKITDLTNPVPILDSIDEHEKYGNNGDMFDGISRSIVNGFEAFSNLLNTIIQKPKELARSISKGITTQLDIIGGKLVGL